jgi:hypothetical protein
MDATGGGVDTFGERGVDVDGLGCIVADPGDFEPGSGSDEVSDPDDAPAEISFHPVLGEAQGDSDPADSEIILTGPDGQLLRLGPPALTSEDIVGVTADGSEALGWLLTIEFSGAGQSRWQQLTSEAACFRTPSAGTSSITTTPPCPGRRWPAI